MRGEIIDARGGEISDARGGESAVRASRVRDAATIATIRLPIVRRPEIAEVVTDGLKRGERLGHRNSPFFSLWHFGPWAAKRAE